ncbi:MAG: hypothetical protein IJV00_09015 [Clostridia bacterium]|nr:hypothetical protein [Clostridia bacterium]
MSKIKLPKSKFCRFAPAILVLAMLLPTFLVACTGINDQGKTNNTPSVTVAPATSSVPASSEFVLPTAPQTTKSAADELFDALPAADYGGEQFRIAAYHSKNIFPSSAGDIIDDLVLERNQKIEDRFNVRLTQVSVPVNDFFNTLKTDYFSGLPGCDLIVAPADMLDYFVTFNMYSNVNTLGIDFSKPCYNMSAMDAMSTGIITYAVAGSLTDSPENSYCVFTNRALLSTIGGEDLTQMVLDGKWTWSELNALAATASKSKLTGLCSSVSDNTFINLVWASTGVHFFTNEPPLNPQIALETNVATNITRLITNTMKSSAYYDNSSRQSKSSLDLFKEGKSLFYISRISQFTSLRSSGLSVAVLPLPKFNEEQSDYSSYIDDTFQVTYVPVNCPDRNRAGAILDALSTSSLNMVNNAYLSLYMHMYLSSNDEALIVNKVFESQYYDIGFVLGPVYNQFASASYDVIYRAITAGASISTMIRQNKTQFYRFLTNKIFDYPKTPESTAPSSSAPASTLSPTSAPATTAPRSTANIPSTASRTTAPSTTAPRTTRAPATAPGTTAPRTSAPASAAPGTAAPSATAPGTTASKTSSPAASSPASTVPATSAPASTAPATSATPGSTATDTSAPASTAPSSSEPASVPPETVPASTAPSTDAPETSSSAAPTEPSASASATVAPPSSSQAPETSAPEQIQAPASSAQPEPSEPPAQTVPSE